MNIIQNRATGSISRTPERRPFRQLYGRKGRSDEKPIGKGPLRNINCDTGASRRNGLCQSADLFWQGSFNASGMYFVEVFNNTSVSATTTLMVQGTGVTLAPVMATTTTTATTNVTTPMTTTIVAQPSFRGGAAPPSPSSAGRTNIDLEHASLHNNQSITIPASTVLWYSFNYVGSTPGSPNVMTITLLNGNTGNLTFSLWTPEQAADMTDQVAIGKGTPTHVDCSVNVCPSADLTWQGSFHTGGTYFVEVFNNMSSAVTTQLLVQGDGVMLGT